MPRKKKEENEVETQRKLRRKKKGEVQSVEQDSQKHSEEVSQEVLEKFADEIIAEPKKDDLFEYSELITQSGEIDYSDVQSEYEEKKEIESDEKEVEEFGSVDTIQAEQEIKEEKKADEQLTLEEASEKQRLKRKKIIPSRLKEIVDYEAENQPYVLLNNVSSKTISELIKLAYDIEIPNPSSMRKQEIITEIMMRAYSDYGIKLYAEGIFQQIDSGVGFLRLSHNNYLQSSDDVFVSKQIIKKYGLRSGDVVFGEIRPPEDENKGKYFSLQAVKSINFSDPWKSKERTLFENLIPYYPTKKFDLDIQFDSDISCRVVDIIAPIGKGQRGLVVSPPRAGKTMLMQNLAKSIITNHPDVFMIVLLIDERPEEVTDWKKNILNRFKDRNIEVVAATFDEKPEIHIKVAEIVLTKAKRLVEYKYDVVVFLDSITRLTRAYNQYIPSSGKVLTGGIDSAALQFPKKFFGAARAIEGGGSLTIIATCLIDTGSRMDEVIFEEFKGTGNMEIYLDRRIAEKRIFPAIDVHRSGTRKEELLIHPDHLPKIWLLRKVLQPMTTIDAMELLHEKISQTKNNNEFFQLILSGG